MDTSRTHASAIKDALTVRENSTKPICGTGCRHASPAALTLDTQAPPRPAQPSSASATLSMAAFLKTQCIISHPTTPGPGLLPLPTCPLRRWCFHHPNKPAPDRDPYGLLERCPAAEKKAHIRHKTCPLPNLAKQIADGHRNGDVKQH